MQLQNQNNPNQKQTANTQHPKLNHTNKIKTNKHQTQTQFNIQTKADKQTNSQNKQPTYTAIQQLQTQLSNNKHQVTKTQQANQSNKLSNPKSPKPKTKTKQQNQHQTNTNQKHKSKTTKSNSKPPKQAPQTNTIESKLIANNTPKPRKTNARVSEIKNQS